MCPSLPETDKYLWKQGTQELQESWKLLQLKIYNIQDEMCGTKKAKQGELESRGTWPTIDLYGIVKYSDSLREVYLWSNMIIFVPLFFFKAIFVTERNWRGDVIAQMSLISLTLKTMFHDSIVYPRIDDQIIRKW